MKSLECEKLYVLESLRMACFRTQQFVRFCLWSFYQGTTSFPSAFATETQRNNDDRHRGHETYTVIECIRTARIAVSTPKVLLLLSWEQKLGSGKILGSDLRARSSSFLITKVVWMCSVPSFPVRKEATKALKNIFQVHSHDPTDHDILFASLPYHIVDSRGIKELLGVSGYKISKHFREITQAFRIPAGEMKMTRSGRSSKATS